jgi:hypothetical protein
VTLRSAPLIDGEEFRNLHLSSLPQGPTPLIVQNSRLASGSLGARVRRPADRLRISNVIVRNCSIGTVTVGPVVFEDVLVDGLRTTRELRLPACAFIHCVLRGRIGSLVSFVQADPLEPIGADMNVAFARANERLYAELDWALDVRDAEFTCFDVRSVPGRLIRINGETQVCVAYAPTTTAWASGWGSRELSPYARSLMAAYLEHRQDYPQDFVLATHRRDPKYAECADLIAAIRQKGLLTIVQAGPNKALERTRRGGVPRLRGAFVRVSPCRSTPC